MIRSLNKIVKVLDSLAIDAVVYDKSNTIPKLAEHALFEQQLFKSQSRQLIHYVQESQALLNQVNKLIENKSSNSLIAHQCQKLVDQCQAIKKALSSQNQRVQSYQIDKKAKARFFEKKRQASGGDDFKDLAKKVMFSSQQLYQELSKHHDYRQRFEQKIGQLTLLLEQSQPQDKMAKQHEILQLQKRLGQCNKAIYFIEQKIDDVEKGKRRF